jgi:acyl carrier protein
MDKLAERARSIIRTQLGMRETDPIATDARIGDLGADDLDRVEIILALEEEFECAIPDHVAEQWATFGDMVAYVARGEAGARGVERPAVASPSWGIGELAQAAG